MGSHVMMKPEDIKVLTAADRVVSGSVHPDTNEPIPFPMRMTANVWFNGPTLMIMLFTRNQSPAFNAFMQWVNQTYNAGVNYGNRSASSPYTSADFGKGYLGAVGASIGIALASRKFFAPRIAAMTGTTAIFASAGLNYIATGSAGGINCALMRSKEVFDGIEVQDESGKQSYGKS